MNMKTILQIIFPILFSPLLVLAFQLEDKYLYYSEFLDVYVFPYSAGIISVIILLFYRSWWQFAVSFALMLVVTIVFGHLFLLDVSLADFDKSFALRALMEVAILHLLALVGFWFFRNVGIYKKSEKQIKVGNELN